jgi:hypothetical protein
MLLAIDFHKDFIDEEGITVSAMTEIESIVEPDCVADDVWRESMTLVCIHPPILSKWQFNLSVPAGMLIVRALWHCLPRRNQNINSR